MLNLSIITINLNNRAGLDITLDSVFAQTYANFEYIIIDGGSKDGSLELIQINSNKMAYWISELDTGIYNAMNKGICQAKGKYCLFLNSGDWLVNENVLKDVFSLRPTADIIAGDVYFFDTDQNKIQWEVPSPDVLTAKTLFLGTLPHQATFIKRSLFETIGFYDESLKIVSDWLFFLKALLKSNATYFHYRGVVSYFAMDGISCNPKTMGLPRREQLAILQQEYPRFVADYERLDNLEKENKHWLQSREYAVYSQFQRIGLMKIGIWCMRLTRFVKRKLSNSL